MWTGLLGTWAMESKGARVDNVTRVPSWYMEEEVARGLTKKDRH